MSSRNQDWSGIQLLVFDLDGTLVDTKSDLAISVNAVRERLALAPLPHDVIATFVGHGVHKLMQRALGEQTPQEVIQEALQVFREHYAVHLLDHSVAYAGVREALGQLREKKMGVLTNKPEGFTRTILSGLSLDSHFLCIYGGDSYEQKKPHPAGLQRVMEDAAARPAETMIIGDSDTDIMTGRNAGVWTCGVTYGFAPHTLETSPPDVLVNDLRDLAALLNGKVSR